MELPTSTPEKILGKNKFYKTVFDFKHYFQIKTHHLAINTQSKICMDFQYL